MAGFATVGDMNVDTRQAFCILVAKLKVYCIGYVITSFSIYPFNVVLAQKPIFGIVSETQLGIFESQVYKSDSIFRSSLKLQIEKWQSQGYFLSSIDRIVSKEDTSRAFLHRGNKFTFVNVDLQDIPNRVLVGSNVSLNDEKRYSAHQLTSRLSQILKYSGTIGYPFAAISLDSLTSNDDDLKVKIQFKPGPYITNDTISFDGLIKTSTNFLARYLHCTSGSPYSEAQFRQINQRLNNLPYLEISKPPHVYFVDGKAKIGGEIRELKINSFDGILGLLQNPGDQSLTLTGLVDLDLYNLFGTGKELKIGWQQQKELSQSLNLHYLHPLIFGSDISIQVDFAQLKQDTSFVNRDVGLGFVIPLQKFKISTTFNRNTGRLLTISPDRLEAADFNTDFYSLGIEYSNFSKKSFPNNGLFFGFNGSFGQKSIRRSAILGLDFYDSIPLKSPIAKIEFAYQSSMRVFNSIYLFHRIRAKAIYNEVLFGNDLFRLGGLNTLRGFNELEFFANQYALSNLEFRWLWSKESYFLLFYDQSFYQIKLKNIQNSDQPAGLGIGLVLATTNGIFRLVYSLGSSATQSFNFNTAKVHFGFTSKF
jgi:translocation and assembly module TamA